MARDQYFVVLHQDAWKIKHNDRHSGPYDTQKAAIRDAVESARKAGDANPDGAQVLVQGADLLFRAEWTYGKDPYPPAG